MPTPTAFSFSPPALVALLAENGVTAEIYPSGVSGSPYDYVYVFLSEDRYDGPHIILSDLLEWSREEDGVTVGYYENEDEGGVDDVPTIAAAITWTLEQIAAYATRTA